MNHQTNQPFQRTLELDVDMDVLVELGVAHELTGKKRNRVFVYDRYLAALTEGMET